MADATENIAIGLANSNLQPLAEYIYSSTAPKLREHILPHIAFIIRQENSVTKAVALQKLAELIYYKKGMDFNSLQNITGLVEDWLEGRLKESSLQPIVDGKFKSKLEAYSKVTSKELLQSPFVDQKTDHDYLFLLKQIEDEPSVPPIGVITFLTERNTAEKKRIDELHNNLIK